MVTQEQLAQAILELKASQEKSDRRLDKVAKLVAINKQYKVIVYDDKAKQEYFTRAIKAYENLSKIKNEVGSKYSIDEVKELVAEFREINEKLEKLASLN